MFKSFFPRPAHVFLFGACLDALLTILFWQLGGEELAESYRSAASERGRRSARPVSGPPVICCFTATTGSAYRAVRRFWFIR
jgi:ABC-type long-subunit fatty acid transport system fused permease/ATPase subunit